MEALVLMKSSSPSGHSDSWGSTRRLLKNRLLCLAKKCKHLQLRWPTFAHSQDGKVLVHVVKGGDTLTSISRMYGVSIYSIAAANLDMINIDIVLEGQRLLIPVSVEFKFSQEDLEKIRNNTEVRCQDSFNIHLTSESRKIFSNVHPNCQFGSDIKRGCYLVLVPVIAFCIGCTIKMLQQKISSMPKQSFENGDASFMSKSTRWREVIYDTTEPADMNTETREESATQDAAEETPACSFEDMSSAYIELEPAYQKFLSDWNEQLGILARGFLRVI